MNKSASLTNLTKALIAAKKKFTPLVRNQENPYFNSNYADLAAVIQSTEAALLENGLVITQFPHTADARVGVQTILMHESGEFLEHEFTLPIGKQDAQTGTAAVTYARRTSWKSVLGISDVDDDGNEAAGREKSTTKTESRSTQSESRPVRKETAPKKTAEPSAEPKKPPRAEIPTELLGSSQKTLEMASSEDSGVSDGIPTEEELKPYRERFNAMVDKLATAGLKASRGIPINRKVLMYLLQTVEQTDISKVTHGQWATFFQVVNGVATSEGGMERLVDLVNTSSIKREEKK